MEELTIRMEQAEDNGNRAEYLSLREQLTKKLYQELNIKD
jgi:hypothetical protein